jgi:phosphoglycolate phosphatase
MPKLVLFDIDGTLVRDGGASRESYAIALREAYGYQADIGRYDFSGKTDPQITQMVLRDDGFDEETIEGRLPELWRIYLLELGKRAVAGRVQVLPGVDRLLDTLETRSDVTLALLTGNIEPGARLKLAPPDLNRYFAVGAFGSDSIERDHLAPIALERANREHNAIFTLSDVVIIGDSIYDVRCGQPHGARTIAVASGRTAGDILQGEGPDAFFRSLEETDAVIDAILQS